MRSKPLFQFPGQGSQAVGMGVSLATSFPEARAVFDEVNDSLGEDLFVLMKEGPEDDLRLTRNAQPALFASSMAALAVLQKATGKAVADLAGCVAGHSLGEYSALAAAGTLSITDAARLLRRRVGRLARSAAGRRVRLSRGSARRGAFHHRSASLRGVRLSWTLKAAFTAKGGKSSQIFGQFFCKLRKPGQLASVLTPLAQLCFALDAFARTRNPSDARSL